jgi:hypothetical protein
VCVSCVLCVSCVSCTCAMCLAVCVLVVCCVELWPSVEYCICRGGCLFYSISAIKCRDSGVTDAGASVISAGLGIGTSASLKILRVGRNMYVWDQSRCCSCSYCCCCCCCQRSRCCCCCCCCSSVSQRSVMLLVCTMPIFSLASFMFLLAPPFVSLFRQANPSGSQGVVGTAQFVQAGGS